MSIVRAPELEQLLQNAYAAHQQGNPELFRALISSDSAAASFGSAPNERFEGPQAVTRMLGENAAGREGAHPLATMEDVVAHREGNVAWAVGDIAFHREEGRDIPFRATAVFHREDGEWKIVQWSVSLLVPDEAVESAWPL